MVQTLITASKPGHPDFATANAKLQANGFVIKSQLVPDQAIQYEAQSSRLIIAQLLAELCVDWCLHESPVQAADVLVCDMDSTIIGQECIDEMAKLAGVGDEIKKITAEAMTGNLEFSSSLGQRVKLLAGQHQGILEKCWEQKITINQGAKTLIATMNKVGAKTALVSGGFNWFAKKVARKVGFAEFHANDLTIKNQHLTGTIDGPTLDAKAKYKHLQRLTPANKYSVAIGDGANDLTMLKQANLGIAYYAKPVLEAQANGLIRHSDLTTALLFQGILPNQWVKVE